MSNEGVSRGKDSKVIRGRCGRKINFDGSNELPVHARDDAISSASRSGTCVATTDTDAECTERRTPERRVSEAIRADSGLLAGARSLD